MNKLELIEVVSSKLSMTKKQAAEVVDAVLDTVAEGLSEKGKVTISGFGTFEVREREAREGRNPQTGETMHIAAHRVPAFKASKRLKDIVQ